MYIDVRERDFECWLGHRGHITSWSIEGDWCFAQQHPYELWKYVECPQCPQNPLKKETNIYKCTQMLGREILNVGQDTEDIVQVGQLRTMGVLLSSNPMNCGNILNVLNVLKIL